MTILYSHLHIALNLNPIEYCFSKIKYTFRKLKTYETSLSFVDMIIKAVNSLTNNDITNSFNHVLKNLDN